MAPPARPDPDFPSPLARPRPLVVREVQPVASLQQPDGHWFIDFGRAAFGTVRLDIECSSSTGAAITVELGEKLTAPDIIDTEPPGCVRYRRIDARVGPGRQSLQVEIPPDERNTGPEAIHMPSELFEVLPFRYAAVTAAGGNVVLHGATQLAVEYPFDDTAASFACSDDRLNRIWELCKYSIRATSFLGVYVDGDRERIPYEADAYINQLGHYCVDSEYELARHTFEYLIEHPTWPTEWALHFVPMAWADYQYTGRIDLLERYYDQLRHKMLLPLARGDGLISTQTGLLTPELLQTLRLDTMADIVDWPPANFAEGVPGERDGYDMVPINTVVNAFYCWNLGLYAAIAAVLGRDDDHRAFATRRKDVATSFHRAFFDPARGVYVDGDGSPHASLHANMFPLAFGLVPTEHEATVSDFIRSRGMACSVYGSQFLLEALYRVGDAEHALSLMTAEHDRGWLNMLKAGSTVTLEAWDHRYKSNLDWNHAWGAAPANIIPRFLVGVRPAEPGFASVLIAPQPAALEWVKATVPTPRGLVTVELEQAGDAGIRRLAVDLPQGSTARIDLSHILPADGDIRFDGEETTVAALRARTLPGGAHRVER